VFKRVLKQCIDKGMVSGRRQAIDGFFIKANASLDSMVEREIMEDAVTYSRELQDNEEQQMPVVNLKERNEPNEKGLRPKKNPSNDTHYSPSDPDAKMSVKPGKSTALNYLGQVAVDTAGYMITHVQAFTADKRDSECLAAMLRHVKSNLLENDLVLEEVLADTGFSSADTLKALQASDITGYIPNRGQFNFERDGFMFDIEGDFYTCKNGKQLTYRTTHLTAGYWMKYYSVSRKECAGCPWSKECSAYGKSNTVIRETIDKPYYDIMHLRMQTRKAKILMKLRQSTVEPVIGTLVNYLGIKRVNAKGLNQANKCLTMAAVAYNLKKMLKYRPKLIKSNLKTLKKLLEELLKAIIPLPTSFALV